MGDGRGEDEGVKICKIMDTLIIGTYVMNMHLIAFGPVPSTTSGRSLGIKQYSPKMLHTRVFTVNLQNPEHANNARGFLSSRRNPQQVERKVMEASEKAEPMTI